MRPGVEITATAEDRARLAAITTDRNAPQKHVALNRTQPGLPLQPGRCAAMPHDYERHGTTTLFAALNVLEGTVIGRCMQRHRHQEFIRLLNAVEAAVPVGKLVHAIRAGSSTSPRPRAPGSMPWRRSSPS
jgi:hypothetical protein